MKVELEMRGLDPVLQMLQSLPPSIVSKRGGPVRAALRKGAVVIFKAAQSNLRNAVSGASDDGERYSTGLLLQNLVVTRGKAPKIGNGERYLVRVRRKSYQRQGQPVTTLKTAQLLEYGSSRQPAEPWLRPAFNAQAANAIRTIETELVKAVGRAARKAAKTRGLG
jgi:HK97 gp10 family phage protein